MAAPSNTIPTSYLLQSSSRLESLARGPAAIPNRQPQHFHSNRHTPPALNHLGQTQDSQHRDNDSDGKLVHRSPSSPLLHTHFRNSTSTISSYYNSRDKALDGGNQDLDVLDDDASVYSDNASTRNYDAGNFTSQYRPSWQTDGTARPDSDVDPFAFRRYESSPMSLPKVVISSPQDPIDQQIMEDFPDVDVDPPVPITPPPFPQIQGRVPSSIPAKLNFSRPNRLPTSTSLDEHKRQVLERNAHRANSPISPRSVSPGSSPLTPRQLMSDTSPTRSKPLVSRFLANTTNGHRELIKNGSVAVPPSPSSSHAASPSSSRPSALAIPSLPTSFQPSPMSATSSSSFPVTPKNAIPALTNLPSLRSSSPVSVYSTYSFYQLESGAPSPENAHFPLNVSDGFQEKAQSPSLPPTSSESRLHIHGSAEQQPQSPEEYLQLGIAHHEANRLKESAYCFEKSATENGGCGVGMLMWGLSLRHAWGCDKDEKKAFRWLKKAAEHTVVDLEAAQEGREALKTELVLAVYEVGQCFFQGWGVPRDKKMAVSYFQTAAQLGDPDAQQDLAFCLANGKGCQKDRKAAAMWYRAAAAQGASTVGLAWIYKPKYTD